MLEIKESLIQNAGLGVFATEDIDEGIILTEYYGKIFTSTTFLEHTLDPSELTALLFHDDLYTVGDVHQYRPEQCGQLINDYRMIENKLYTDKTFDHAISLYHDDSLSHSNVSALTNSSKHYIQSTKRINKGDELYFHYGPIYWIEHFDSAYRSKHIEDYCRSIIFCENLRVAVLNFKKEKQSA